MYAMTRCSSVRPSVTRMLVLYQKAELNIKQLTLNCCLVFSHKTGHSLNGHQIQIGLGVGKTATCTNISQTLQDMPRKEAGVVLSILVPSHTDSSSQIMLIKSR